MKGLIEAIAHVSSFWSFAACVLAVILAALKVILATPTVVRRRGAPAPPALASAVMWPIVLILFLFGFVTIAAHTYIRTQEINLERQKLAGGIYRVRVIVVDQRGNPVVGATLRTTASGETTTTYQGIAEVSLPKVTLPVDGRITIFADLDSAFLHGRTELKLANDFSPSVTIVLGRSLDATVTVLVEDENGLCIDGATVLILGGDSGTTNANGTFTLKANAATGQIVRIHVQKSGYTAVDRDIAAGDALTLTLTSQASGESSAPLPSRTAADASVIKYKGEVLSLRMVAETRDPGWESTVRQKATQLADLMGRIDDRQLSAARVILNHEYRGWALLMVADTYDESQDAKEVQTRYAEEAIREFDLALQKMEQISRDSKANIPGANAVYEWMTGESEDRNRTHYLKAAALAVAARAHTAGSRRTLADVKKELDQIVPAYLTTHSPENHPALAWAKSQGTALPKAHKAP